MKCYLHDYSGLTMDQLREDITGTKRPDGFHLGYFSYSPVRLTEEQFDKTLKEAQRQLDDAAGNIRALYQIELPVKLDITPAINIGDLMVEYGINPLYPRRFSDWCVIQCTRYIKDGHVYWWDDQRKLFTNEPRSTTRFK